MSLRGVAGLACSGPADRPGDGGRATRDCPQQVAGTPAAIRDKVGMNGSRILCPKGRSDEPPLMAPGAPGVSGFRDRPMEHARPQHAVLLSFLRHGGFHPFPFPLDHRHTILCRKPFPGGADLVAGLCDIDCYLRRKRLPLVDEWPDRSVRRDWSGRGGISAVGRLGAGGECDRSIPSRCRKRPLTVAHRRNGLLLARTF